MNSHAYQRRRDELVLLLDALHRLHLPVALPDWPAHVLKVLNELLPGHVWTFVPIDQDGDSPPAGPAFAAAVLGPAAAARRMTVHAVPRAAGAVRQRADLLFQGLTPHVTLARANAERAVIIPDRPVAAAPEPVNPVAPGSLTRREREVLHWMGEGKRDAEIAVILSISARTVQKHVQNLMVKLGVETRTAAVRSGARSRGAAGPGRNA